MNKKDEKKLSRSIKMRKYESVYKSYLRKSEQSKIKKSPRIPRKTKKTETRKETKEILSKMKRKTLNPYQKFVQTESKKEKYKNYSGKERLRIIADEWKRIRKA
jgi:hypothetical protein